MLPAKKLVYLYYDFWKNNPICLARQSRVFIDFVSPGESEKRNFRNSKIYNSAPKKCA